jgi:UDP:flavonoid glycosyltransferase YjiC (YdhE family)
MAETRGVAGMRPAGHGGDAGRGTRGCPRWSNLARALVTPLTGTDKGAAAFLRRDRPGRSWPTGRGRMLRPPYERHGLVGPAPVAAWLDIAPPSMSTTDEANCWFMRYVPYSGGGRLPEWLTAARERPRVTVTLGTVRSVVDGVAPVKWVVDAARETDA